MRPRDWTKIPGNRSASDQLESILKAGSALAFVGAGSSAPSYPLWGSFLNDLIDAAVDEGRLAADKRAKYEQKADHEPTHVAEELERVLGKGLLRQKISDVFGHGKGCTETHLRLLELPFRGYITTNYDHGLSLARSQVDRVSHPLPMTWRSPERDGWFLGEHTHGANPGRPILHLHGLTSDPESLVLSERQYGGPYTDPSFALFFKALWSYRSLVFVGFGFTDPWIRALARTTSAMHGEIGEPRHVAILGLTSEDLDEIEFHRRVMQREFNCRVLYYPVKQTTGGGSDHSALQELLTAFKSSVCASIDPVESSPREAGSEADREGSELPGLPKSDVHMPFLRIEIQRLGENHYGMEIETRYEETQEVVRMRREFPVRNMDIDNWSEKIFRRGQSQSLFEDLVRLRRSGVPLRMQIILAAAERSLDRIAWEALRWDGEVLGFSRHIIFSRRFLFTGDDYGALKINSSVDLDFSIIEIPQEPEREEAGRTWLLPSRLSEENEAAFDHLCRWRGEGSINLDDIWRELERSEVAYVRLPLGVRPKTDFNDIKIPLPRDPNARLYASDLEGILSVLRRLAHSGPSVIILPAVVSEDGERCPQELIHFAGELARTGIAAVIVPFGDPLPSGLWDSTVREIIGGLRSHGVIDLAVATACQKLQTQARLYLRSKSGRLFYRPGLVVLRDSRSRPTSSSWEALDELFSSEDPSKQCVVLVGPDIDPELRLSRRRIAKELASKYGFSLSRRDMEDLAKVAEYIRVSQPASAEETLKLGSEALRAHVSAFMQCTKNYLLKHPLVSKHPLVQGHRLSENDSLEKIAAHVGEQRLREFRSPYHELAGLRVKQYVTPSFHSILEEALKENGKKPTSVSFSRRPELEALEDVAMMSVETPLVYHCFGSFSQPENLLLSETDFLEFFAAFCREDDPLTSIVRGNLVDASLLILGFSPNSWDFKLLYSAIRSMGGSRRSKKHVHVAVQVDPEDDFTIDPDGARNFYRGLLSELGSEDVFLYWGRSTQFLNDLRKHVPNAFQGGGHDGA